MSTFEFANEWVPTNSIDIPEIGNFYLEAIDEENLMYYYLMIKSSLGTASVMSYGPVVPDVQLLPDKYQVSFERLSFNDKKIAGLISEWLNDKSKGITAAYIIDQNKFFDNYRDLKEYMNSYSDEVY